MSPNTAFPGLGSELLWLPAVSGATCSLRPVELMIVDLLSSVAVIRPARVSFLIRIVIVIRDARIAPEGSTVHIIGPRADLLVGWAIAADIDVSPTLPSLELVGRAAHTLDGIPTPIGLVLGSSFSDDLSYPR